MDMNLLKLLPFLFVGLGLGWALWLIFKRNILEQGVLKVLTYFIGVIITLMLVGWIVGNFLPRWSAQLLNNTRQSEDIETIETLGRQIWQEAMGENPTLPEPTQPAEPTTEPPIATPEPTVSPVSGPNVGSQGAAVAEVRYVVQQGDTLNSIARKFNVSVDVIQRRNGLYDPNLIYPGDTLIIPTQ
jgi:LysM repeat protein